MIAAVGRFGSIVLLVGLVQSSTAQTPPELQQMDESMFDKFLSNVHIDAITDSPVKVVVRVSRVTGDGRIVPGDPMTCWRGH